MGVIVVVLPKLENAKKVKKILLEHGCKCNRSWRQS